MAGPRGQINDRPEDPNELGNLILLCPTCHKLVDDNPDRYTVELLREYKADHEDRIRRQTECDKTYETTVVIVRSRIGNDIVTIPGSHILDAIAPRYPSDSRFFEIDLTAIEGCVPDFYTVAGATIGSRLRELLRPESAPTHISLFALAPIPLLMHLGSTLSNKVAIELYQRHRDTGAWRWKEDGRAACYAYDILRRGTDRGHVALLLSLSGTIDPSSLPAEIDETYTLYRFLLQDREPTPDFLQSRADLTSFQTAYRGLLSTIGRDHGIIHDIAVFPAVPAPVAVACGLELLPKVHPQLRVYDYDKLRGGFTYVLTVNGDRDS